MIAEASAHAGAVIARSTSLNQLRRGATLTTTRDISLTNFDTSGVILVLGQSGSVQDELCTDVRSASVSTRSHQAADEQVYNGYAILADGMQPVLSIAYRPEDTNTVYNFDAEKAKSLLEEAGWVDSDGDGIREKDGVKFSFECLFSEGVATYEQQLPFMQQSWADVGIEMKPTAVPFTAARCIRHRQLRHGRLRLLLGSSPDGTSGDVSACVFIRRRASTPCATANPEFDTLSIERTRCSARGETHREAQRAVHIVNVEQAAGKSCSGKHHGQS